MLTTVPLALGPSWLDPDTMLTTFGHLAVWLSALVLFAECGLLLGFFLPGDSLLFTVGLFIGRGDIDEPLWLACLVLTVAAFAGNVVGYEIGRASGPTVFGRQDSRVFKPAYVDRTMAFFAAHGPRAIVLARFVPIVRTFITLVAGVGKMDRRTYLVYSGIGAVLWATGVTLLGRALGRFDVVHDHIEAALILVVAVSVLPMIVEAVRHRRRTRRPPGPSSGRHAAGASDPAAVSSPSDVRGR